MRFIESYLEENSQRLALDRYGIGKRAACVLVTPRFYASSHVVFLVLGEESGVPSLVAKVPRLPGADDGVRREAANLNWAHASQVGGYQSIPRLVALDQCSGHRILLQTALVGRTLDRRLIRRRRDEHCRAATQWLAALPFATSPSEDGSIHWFERLVRRPLRRFADTFPLTRTESRLLEQTRRLVAPLRDMNLPLVLEHRDMSPPNLMLLSDSSVGAVDWELAEPRGLPACDLFFFLAYAAFASQNAWSSGHYVPAFETAFMGTGAWARRYVTAYAAALKLPSETLTPLLAVCWLRYMTGLLSRLPAAGEGRPVEHSAAQWLRNNRYYELWRHTIDCQDRLSWE